MKQGDGVRVTSKRLLDVKPETHGSSETAELQVVVGACEVVSSAEEHLVADIVAQS
jgi:hypothetical protein